MTYDTWLSKLDVFTDSSHHVFIVIIGYNKLLIIPSQPSLHKFWSFPHAKLYGIYSLRHMLYFYDSFMVLFCPFLNLTASGHCCFQLEYSSKHLLYPHTPYLISWDFVGILVGIIFLSWYSDLFICFFFIIFCQIVYHVQFCHYTFFASASLSDNYICVCPCVWSVSFLFSWLCNLKASLPLMKLTLYALQTKTNNNLHISTVTPQEYWHSLPLPLLLTLHLFFLCSLHSITNFIAFFNTPLTNEAKPVPPHQTFISRVHGTAIEAKSHPNEPFSHTTE